MVRSVKTFGLTTTIFIARLSARNDNRIDPPNAHSAVHEEVDVPKPSAPWRGSFPAIATPFTADGEIDERLVRANVNLTVSDGVHGLVMAAHNGEAHLMSMPERQRVIAIGVDETAGRIPVVAGAGGIATRDVIAMTRFAREAGAVAALIEPPYFITPKDDDIVRHFAAVSDAVDLPIWLYNNPSRAGVSLTPELTDRLANLTNIVAIKDSSADFVQVTRLLQTVGDRMSVFIGNARLFGFAGVTMGAAGFVDGLPQVAGRRAVELYDFAVARDVERGQACQAELFRIGEALYRAPGTFPATMKDAMNLLGRPGGYPRPPLYPMQGEDLARLERTLRENGCVPLAATT